MTTGDLISKNIKVVDEKNNSVKINHLISDEGGQGTVYHVTYKGKNYALKWYCKHPDDVIGGDQYKTIKTIHGEKHKPSSRFIWPLYIVTEENPKVGKRFGYLMDLLPNGYKEMEDFLRKDSDPKKARFGSYNSILVAGMSIAKAMQDLHMRGWSYKDLNPKNFMINPDNGAVLVVDNDNVSVDDDDLCSVKGMRGYMAPEIPRSKYTMNPAIETDRYSLAIVLYRLLFIDHPMDGKLWERYPLCTDKTEDEMYAINPVFHFNPHDSSNRPTNVFAPNAKVRWNINSIFSKELRDTFTVTFTDGITNPGVRPSELEWISVLSNTRDKLVRSSTGKEQFINFDNINTVPPGCLSLKVGTKKIAIYPGKAIYGFTITGDTKQYNDIVGGIVYDEKMRKMKLRNLTDQIWRCYSPSTKQISDLSKNQEYPLEPGVQIEFHRERPKKIGEIENPRR